MLLLVTIVLVLIAAVTLLIGIFGDNLPLIFVSIGASVFAAIVLGVVSQMTKRRPAEATAGAVPLAPPAVEPVTAGVGAVGSAAEEAPEPVTVGAGAVGGPVGGAVAMPIGDYDSLRVNDIMPKLEGLDLDQLEAVAQHEESNKNRSSVLNRIDQLMDELEAAEAAGAAAQVGAAAVGSMAGSFPIAGYDERDTDEIVELLADLDADELEVVAEYEETHANRDVVLDAIDDRLDELEGIAPPAAAPPRVATAVKKTAKKAATKKAATKATAKKAAARKTTTKAAPAKRATTRAATPAKAVRKAAAPAKRTASTAKKATATKKSTKAAPKKTAARKTTKAAPKKAAKKATRR